jgi:Holliday junction DNA helicase RuvA
MIGSLRGVVLARLGTAEVLVEVAGVGYRVTVSPATVVQLGEPGAEVFLHIHHHIREDAQTLYGFLAADERSCFEALLGAHGVGPSLALAILSVHEPLALAGILADEDVAALCLVPGVGKKTAARLLVELQARLDIPTLGEGASPATVAGTAGGGSARSDVREALVNLGYSSEEVAGVLRDLPDGADSSVLLRDALQRLAVS